MFISRQRLPLSRSQGGVTLLEVLVSILVLSFGLLGMLGFIVNGLKMTTSSHYRTIAAQQLSAIADVVNAVSSSPTLVAQFAAPTATQTTACLTTTGCPGTAASMPMPQMEYYLWRANLASLLPGGTGVICLDSTPADGSSAEFACDGLGRLTVKVCWNESGRIDVAGGGAWGTSTTSDTCISHQL